MNHRLLCLPALCLILTGCSGGEPPTDVSATGEAASGEAGTAAGTSSGADRPAFEPDTGLVVNEAFLTHMHAHAEMLDEINYALSDDDLESTRTPAYWLAKHHDFKDMPNEWKAHAAGMREAAAAVEAAQDLETARAAAGRIEGYCRDCHAAAGITDEYN